MLSTKQRHLVFDAIPCILGGDALPIMQVNDDLPNFYASIPSWIVGTVLVQGISSLYPGKGQLRRTWNAAKGQYDIWDGEIYRATLTIDVRSTDKAKVFNYASELVWDIKENYLHLVPGQDKVWLGPDEIMSVRDLGSYEDTNLGYMVHRVQVEVQLEYEVSFLKPGYPILRFGANLRQYGKGGAAILPTYYMIAPKILSAYMSIGLDMPKELTADMILR